MSEADRITRELLRHAERVVTKVSLDVVANLKEAPSDGETGTPIDTSWASSNWVPYIGADRTVPVGTPENVTRGPQGQGELSLLSYRLGQGTVFISNNVGYIGLLNTTNPSPQQPPGFVERAINKALTVDLRSRP